MLDHAAVPHSLSFETLVLIEESLALIAWTNRLNDEIRDAVEASIRLSRESSRIVTALDRDPDAKPALGKLGNDARRDW